MNQILESLIDKTCNDFRAKIKWVHRYNLLTPSSAVAYHKAHIKAYKQMIEALEKLKEKVGK